MHFLRSSISGVLVADMRLHLAKPFFFNQTNALTHLGTCKKSCHIFDQLLVDDNMLFAQWLLYNQSDLMTLN